MYDIDARMTEASEQRVKGVQENPSLHAFTPAATQEPRPKPLSPLACVLGKALLNLLQMENIDKVKLGLK